MKLATDIRVGSLERLLRPRSVAVIGASPTPGSLGASVIENLDRLGFPGDVYLINPKRDQIGRRPCLKSVADLPQGIDLAVLAVPKVVVLDTIRALADRQVGAAIIFAAGFAEGGETGLREQQEIARIARSSGMIIEGPNCLGFTNHVEGIALTFVKTSVIAQRGRSAVGIVSQSGAMACVVAVTLAARDLAVSYSVSTGNEAATGLEDYTEFLLDDATTHVIGLIAEQFRQPRRFLEIAKRARDLGKTIVLLHPGRSSAARESAATHTGAMAGDYLLMRTKVERAGVIVAESLEEFGDILEVILRCRALPSSGTAVLTESGAFKALMLDLSEQIHLSLPTLDNDSSPALRAAMPEFVPVSNPLDLTAQGLVDPDLYRRTIVALEGDERIGTIIVCIIQNDAATCGIKFPPILAALKERNSTKAVLVAGVDDGAVVPAEYIHELRTLGVPYFPTVERVLRALSRLVTRESRDTEVLAAPPPPTIGSLQQGVIPEYQAKNILRPCGIPFPVGRFVRTRSEAQAAAKEIGYPVVLKAQSADLSHKSDAGGVVLSLEDDAAVRAGWDELHASIARHRPGLVLDGVLIERMGPRGLELIIGGRNDPQWGAVTLAGFGGVQAEVLKDVRLLPADLTQAGILRELDLLKGAAILRGFRGSPALDVTAVARIIGHVGQLLQAEPSIREIDLNPVIVYPAGAGAMALDALMVCGDAETDPSFRR